MSTIVIDPTTGEEYEVVDAPGVEVAESAERLLASVAGTQSDPETERSQD